MTGPISSSSHSLPPSPLGAAGAAPFPAGQPAPFHLPDRELTFISETTERDGRRFLPEIRDMRKWFSEQVGVWKLDLEPHQISGMEIEATLRRDEAGDPFLVDHHYGTPTLRFEIDFRVTFPEREEPITFSMDYYTAEPISLDRSQMWENKASALHNVESFIDCLLWRAYKHSPPARQALERRSPIENLAEVADKADFSNFVTPRHCYTLHHQIPRTLGKLRKIHFPDNAAEEQRREQRIQHLTEWQGRMPGDFHELRGECRLNSRRVVPKMTPYHLPVGEMKMCKSWVERHIDELADHARRVEANEAVTRQSAAVQDAQQELRDHLLDNLSDNIEDPEQLLHFIDRSGIDPELFAQRQRELLVAEQREFDQLADELTALENVHPGLDRLTRFKSQVDKRERAITELQQKITRLDESLATEEAKVAAASIDPSALGREWELECMELEQLKELVDNVSREVLGQDSWDRYEYLRRHTEELEAQLTAMRDIEGYRASAAGERLAYTRQITRVQEQIRTLHRRRAAVRIGAEELEHFQEGNSRLRKLERSIAARLRHLRGITFHCHDEGWIRLQQLYPQARDRLLDRMRAGYFDLIGGVANPPRRIVDQEELIKRRNQERVQAIQN